jgi:hypothetical protein
MVDDLADLDRRIAAALSTVRGARAAARHSLDGRTRWDEEMAERRLDDLLDQRARSQVSDTATAPAAATAEPPPSRWSR